MSLDIKTLIISQAITILTLGLLLRSYGSAMRVAEHTNRWALALVVKGAGLALVGVGSTLEVGIIRISGLGLYTASWLFELTALRNYFHRGAGLSLRLNLILSGCMLIALIVTYALTMQPFIPFTIASFAIALLCLACFRSISGESGRSPLSRILAFGYLIVAATYIVRGLVGPLLLSDRIDSPDDLNITLFILSLLVILVISVGFIIHIKEDSERALFKLANRDHLTGAHNRRYFDEALYAMLDDKQSLPLSVAILDLDYFKQVNDTYGHDSGDKVLQAFTEFTQARAGAKHIFARLGGEEFALLMPKFGPREAKVLVDQLRLDFANLQRDKIPVTFSAGLVTTYNPVQTKQLMVRADTALYQAKALGRNRVEVFSAS